MYDFQDVFPVVPIFLSISLCILQDVANGEAYTMTAVNDEFRGLKFGSGIMFIIGAVNVGFQFIEDSVLKEFVIDVLTHVCHPQ